MVVLHANLLRLLTVIFHSRSPTRAPESTDDTATGVEVSDGSSLEYDEVTPESLQLSHQSQMPNLHTVSVVRGSQQVVKSIASRVSQLFCCIQRGVFMSAFPSTDTATFSLLLIKRCRRQ